MLWYDVIMIHEKMKDEIRAAALAKDREKLNVVRGLVAAFTNELVAKSKKPTDLLSDDDALAVIRRAAKQRKESIEQYTKGGRPDLAKTESAELLIVESYLPAQMSRDAILKIARAKQKELAVTDKAKTGVLMSALMKHLKGKADGAVVREVVEEMFRN